MIDGVSTTRGPLMVLVIMLSPRSHARENRAVLVVEHADCWTGFILFADAIVYRPRGNSWIRSRHANSHCSPSHRFRCGVSSSTTCTSRLVLRRPARNSGSHVRLRLVIRNDFASDL